MNKMIICRFKKHHIEKLQITKEERAEMLDYYDLYLRDGLFPAITIKSSGMVQGIGGIRFISKNVGESWMCWNFDFLHQHKKRIIVKIKDYIDFACVTFNLKRVQAVIDIENVRDKRFIEFLGFKYEKELESGFDTYVKGV